MGGEKRRDGRVYETKDGETGEAKSETGGWVQILCRTG